MHPTVQNNTYSPTAAPYNNNNNNVSTINDAVYQSAPTYPLNEPIVTAFQSPKQFTGSVLRQTLTLPNSDSSTSSDQASPVNDLAQVGQQRNSFPGSESSSGVSTSYENIPSLNTSHVTQYRPVSRNKQTICYDILSAVMRLLLIYKCFYFEMKGRGLLGRSCLNNVYFDVGSDRKVLNRQINLFEPFHFCVLMI